MDREAATLEIKARLNIVDVIGRYIPLERSGRNYKGLCPFHREKTPSFNVEPEKQFYYCFGCHAKGDIFSFVMHMEGWDFVEALKHLAAEAGVELDTTQTENPYKGLLEIMEQVCQFYQRRLPNSVALQYFQKRGITPESIRKFRLGYAPDGWESLASSGIKASEKELLDCGLIQKRRTGTGHYDRFRHRAIFPIFDTLGRVVAFGARALGDDKPKYLNSPEGIIFHKKETLYGWHLAKEAVRNSQTIILVEGYMDVIACHEAGITNVVASMGTALTEEQIDLLGKQAKKVILAYDGDAAGQMAIRRGVMMLLGRGFEVCSAQFPASLDPDDVLRKQGPQSLQESIYTAENYLHKIIRQATESGNLEAVGAKTKFLQEIAPLLNALPSKSLQEEYFQRLSELTNLSYTAVESEVLSKSRGEYERSRSRYNNRVSYGTSTDPTIDVYSEAELDLVAMIFGDPSYINEATAYGFEINWLEHEGLRNILAGVLIPSNDSQATIDKEAVELIRELAERLDKIDELRFRDCLKKLAEREINRQIEELSVAVANSSEPDFYLDALKKLKEIYLQVKDIAVL